MYCSNPRAPAGETAPCRQRFSYQTRASINAGLRSYFADSWATRALQLEGPALIAEIVMTIASGLVGPTADSGAVGDMGTGASGSPEIGPPLIQVAPSSPISRTLAEDRNLRERERSEGK